jgi:hypothetical protein
LGYCGDSEERARKEKSINYYIYHAVMEKQFLKKTDYW